MYSVHGSRLGFELVLKDLEFEKMCQNQNWKI